MEKNDGGSAFPLEYKNGDFQDGMTLRDFFAAKAMQGMMSLESTNEYLKGDTEVAISTIAKGSYLIADAMIDAREGK